MKKQRSHSSIRQIDKSTVYLALAAILTVAVLFATVSTSHAVWVECEGMSKRNRYEALTLAELDGFWKALNEIIGKDHPHYEEIERAILFGENFDASSTKAESYKIMRKNLEPYIANDHDLQYRGRFHKKNNIREVIYVYAGNVEFNDGAILATVERVTEPYKKKGLFSKVTSFFSGDDSELQARRAELCRKELGKWKYPYDFVYLYGGTLKQLPGGAYYDKNTKSEMITLEATDLEIKVIPRRMKVLKKWVQEAHRTKNKQITRTIIDLYGMDKKENLCIVYVIRYGRSKDEFSKFKPIDKPDFRIKHDSGVVENPKLPNKLTFAVPMKLYNHGKNGDLVIDYF